MNIDAQMFLDLAEKANKICFFDIESTGFKGDYNSILVGSISDIHERATSFSILQPGNDKKVVRELKEELESYDCWVTYYGKGFDIPMLNTRLLKWGLRPVEKRHHVDLYYTLKHNLNTSRRGLGHMVRWLDVPEQKMDVDVDVWTQIAVDVKKNIKILVDRCESDTVALKDLYLRTRHLIADIKR